MSLVDYSSSDSEDDKKSPPIKASTLKRKASSPSTPPRQRQPPPPPPPLPSSFHSLYATSVRSSTADDPNLHGGRKRQTPHVQGNWPTHVYLEWVPTRTQLSRLEDLIEHTRKHALALTDGEEAIRPKQPAPAPAPANDVSVHSFLRSPLNAPLALHISLSAPLVLTTEIKDDFLLHLTTELSRPSAGQLRRFSTTPRSLKWVANHDRSRHFLVLGDLAKPSGDQLNELLKRCNAIARKFGLVQLYAGKYGGEDMGVDVEVGGQRAAEDDDAQPKARHGNADSSDRDRSRAFHVSIAWSLQSPSKEMQKQLGLIDVAEMFQGVESAISFSDVKIKIGNVIEQVTLAE